MVGLRLTLLGGFEAWLGSGASVRLPTKKAQGLLAYLGASPGQCHRRDKLAALLWGDKSDDQARDGLRHALVAIRKALANAHPPPMRIEGQTLGLDTDAVEVDVVTFERRVAEGTPQALDQAAELYRGDLLLGFDVREPLFEEWLVAERERLREMALEALARLLAHQTKTAGGEPGIQTALRLLSLDPLQETVHRALMRLYGRQGRRGAALKQYQMCVSVLRHELGTEPEAETRTLYEDLLRRPVVAVAASHVRGGHRPPAAHTMLAAPPDLPALETPLFGRQAELGRLWELLDEAIRGHGHIASVVGEAGIGKTRLVTALVADSPARGCRIWIGRCHESDSILPFGPWVEACRSGEVGADEEVLGALHPTRRAELTRLLPEASVAGLPRPSDNALPLFESVATLIEQVAAREPLVLMLEDVHWADQMSLRLLAFVSRRIVAWPALLIITAREEELTDASMARQTLQELSRAPHATPLVLAALSRADTALLVQALVRVGTDTPRVAQVEEQIWAMSEGNPFVAVEAMRSLDRDGPCAGTRTEPGGLALPKSVHDLVARRLDRLSPRSQQLAAAAAVIGRQFDFTLLRLAGELEEPDAAESVEEMVRHHVLQAVGDRLDFTHDRVRDVAYSRLLLPRRRLLHRAVAEALETLGAGAVDAMATSPRDRLGEQIEQLAHHALRGELWDKAVHYLRQAGYRAAARSALQDARTLFEQALSVLETLPESRSTLEQAFEIRLELRSVLTQLGEPRRMLERLREAQTLAERLDDDHRRVRVCAFVMNVQSMLGELDEACVAGARGLAIARTLGDFNLRILTTSYLELAHYMRSDYSRVVELAKDNLASLPAERVYDYFGIGALPAVFDRSWLIMSLAELGTFSEAAVQETEAMRLAESTHHAFTVGYAHRAASTLHLLKGDWMEARSLIEHWIEVVRTGNIVIQLPTAIASSAWALAQLREASEAMNRLGKAEQFLERQAASGIVVNLGWGYHSLGRACLVLGRLNEARRFAERAIESSSSQPGFAAHALHLLGDIAAHPDRFDAESAGAHYHQALALAAPRGMRPLIAHCHLGLGRLHRQAGKRDHALERLTTAATMYADMGMTYWRDGAERELKTIM